jgi:hypothetical protein
MAAMTPQLQQETITARTSGAGVVNCSNYNNIVVYIEASAALSNGTLIIEESRRMTETNTWSTIATVTLSTQAPFDSGAGQFGYHLPFAAYTFIRTRIGTTVVGGTITVEVAAN